MNAVVANSRGDVYEYIRMWVWQIMVGLIGIDTLNIQLACKYCSNTHVWYSAATCVSM